MGCTKLDTINIDKNYFNLKQLDPMFFMDAPVLKQLILIKKTQNLQRAFQGCTALTEITISNSETNIEEGAILTNINTMYSFIPTYQLHKIS